MIYSVEDDVSIRELICYTLNSQNLPCVGFENGEKLFEGINREIPDLILLDIMLPNEDGISILKRLKSNFRTKNIEIIMVSALDSEIDKVTALDFGADDYIAKPFGMMEMLSRVKAVLRRKSTDDDRNLQIGNLKIDFKNYKVFENDEEITLTLKEFNLLKCLVQNVNIVLSREQILSKVWGYDDIETRTLDAHIKSLRQKLNKSGDLIETVRGVGYVVRSENAKKNI
ncbi:MAG: response regulator transcription factor [Clostridia bacterium]